MFKEIEVAEEVYEGNHLIKTLLGKIPTVTVISWNEREDNLRRLTIPRKAKMQAQDKKSSLYEQEDVRCRKKFLLHGPGHSSEDCKVLK